MNLYEIQKESTDLFKELEDSLTNDNLSEDKQKELEDRLALNESNLKDKATNYAKFTKSLGGEILAIDEEIKRLEALKKTKVTLKNRLESVLRDSLLNMGIDNLDLGLFRLSFRKSEAVNSNSFQKYWENIVMENNWENIVVTNLIESSLDYGNDWFVELNSDKDLYLEKLKSLFDIEITIKPNKKNIKEELKHSDSVYGCEIITNKNLQIK